MKTCLMITGGSIDLPFAGSFLKKHTYDMIIAVDAGLAAVKALGLTPQIVVGDFDTVSEDVLKEYQAQDKITWEIHKPEKNETDTELAMDTAISLNCTEVTILGATGGRMDHALGNIQLLYAALKKGVTACIVDEKNKITVINQDREFEKNLLWGNYISFLPLSEEVKGITLTGFKYPLQQKNIGMGEEVGLCISNELAQERGSISFTRGVLLCIEAHD